MQFNVIIEVAIGLVVLFWVVATTASFIVETITSFVNLRGRALEMFVREMLATSGTAQSLRKALKWFPRTAREERPIATPATGSVGLDQLDVTDHPLIRRLAKPSGFISGGDTSPSYIPADLFTKALLDRLRQLFGGLLAAADAARAVRAALPAAVQLQTEVPLHLALSKLDAATAWGNLLMAMATENNPGQTLDAARMQLPEGPAKLALGILAARLAKSDDWVTLQKDTGAFIQSVWPDIAQILGSRTPTVADLQAIVASGSLPSTLSSALRPLLDAANHDMEIFRKALEGWYESVMDRATGWFRRYAQAMLLAASFVTAAGLNLDAFHIGKRLLADPDARAAAVRVAETIVQEGVDAPSLVQVYGFDAAYRDGEWATPLKVGKAEEKLKAADDLAIRVQPRLLKSGALIGPMLALQAAVLRAERRCVGKSDGECEPAKATARWKEMTDLQDPLLAALCRASLVRAEDRAWADALSDAELVAAISDTAKATARCQTQLALVRAKDKGALRALDELWASRLVVWNPALGTAAWDVRQLAQAQAPSQAPPVAAPPATGSAAAAAGSSPAPSPKADAVAGAFATAMGNAVADARQKVKSADDLLSRLPHVGPGGVWGYWKGKAASASPSPAVEASAAPATSAAPASSTLSEVTSVLSRAGAWVVLGSFAGWLVTAFMASLGAPMWFDLLNKLVNRRISGPKPEPGAGVP